MKRLRLILAGVFLVPSVVMATTYPACPSVKLASSNGCANQGTQSACVKAYWTQVNTQVVCTTKQGSSSDNCQSQQVTVGYVCGWTGTICSDHSAVTQCQP